MLNFIYLFNLKMLIFFKFSKILTFFKILKLWVQKPNYKNPKNQATNPNLKTKKKQTPNKNR